MIKQLVLGCGLAVSLALGAGALLPASADASIADTASMSSSEYKKIKKGMSYAKVKHIVGGKGDCYTFGSTRRCEWRYRGDLGFAQVDFSKKTGKAKTKWYTAWH